MSDMIEAVAKGILAGHDWTHDAGNDPAAPVGWDAVPPDWRDAYRSMARSGLEATADFIAGIYGDLHPGTVAIRHALRASSVRQGE